MVSLVTHALGRYLLIGLLATAIHYAVLFGLVEFAHAAAAPSAAFGAACGALAAYAGNHRITFPGHGPHRQALPRFLTVATVCAAANGAIVWAGTVVLGAHYFAAQVVATATVLWAGFTCNRRWSFA